MISDILGNVPGKSVIALVFVMSAAVGSSLTLSGARHAVRQQGSAAPAQPPAISPQNPPLSPRATLNIVVLDPAHGGADSGARGASGINESEVVLEFAKAVRAALEAQGLRVVQTRTGNDDPSFDDRSAIVNGQRGAIFITLHVSSSGTPGQVRAYSAPPPVGSDPSAALSFPGRNGLLPWDRAQDPYAAASRKLAELAQTGLTQKFDGSPAAPLVAAVRQLRTVAAPAIAIEASSVSIASRDQLIQMAPGLADAIAQAVKAFRPIYEGGAH
jgi:N-acetylmuramoyl-L-alanine amidase